MTSENRAPAFQFYPGDYLASMKVQRMDYEAQGVCFQLLCHMWVDSKDYCSIENDEKMLRKLLKLTPYRWKKNWEQIQHPGDAMFALDNGKLISKELKERRLQQIENREKKSKAGKKGADARWQGHDSAIRPAIDVPMANDGSSASVPASLSSPSSSSIPSPTSSTSARKKTGPEQIGQIINNSEISETAAAARILKGAEAYLADDDLGPLLERFVGHGYDPVKVWAAGVMARGKDKPAGFFVSLLDNPKFGIEEWALNTAKEEMRKIGHHKKWPLERS